MARVLTDNCCVVCGIPLDAEYFDVSGFVGAARTQIYGELVNPFRPSG